MKNKKYHIYVVHGYTASSKDEWFPWLKNKLNGDNLEVTLFDMPNSNFPSATQWDTYLDKNITDCNENTFFVSHSLGCIALLRYMEKQPIDQKIGGVVLVSGFLEEVSTLPMLNSFIKPDLNVNKLAEMIEDLCVISSPSDSIVPYSYSCELAKQLNAKLIAVKNGGHFLAREGFTEFPLVYDVLSKMIKEKNNIS